MPNGIQWSEPVAKTRYVKIVSPIAVEYSLTNGFNFQSYKPGEYYEVPEFVWVGMRDRGWAIEVDPQNQEIPQAEAPPPKIEEEPTELPPLPLSNGGDHSEEIVKTKKRGRQQDG